MKHQASKMLRNKNCKFAICAFSKWQTTRDLAAWPRSTSTRTSCAVVACRQTYILSLALSCCYADSAAAIVLINLTSAVTLYAVVAIDEPFPFISNALCNQPVSPKTKPFPFYHFLRFIHHAHLADQILETVFHIP